MKRILLISLMLISVFSFSQEDTIMKKYYYPTPKVGYGLDRAVVYIIRNDSARGISGFYMINDTDTSRVFQTQGQLYLDDGTTGVKSLAELASSGAYQQLVTVAKSGGEYTSIQDAINSITDNSSSKRYVILIYPGTYTENIVMEEYVSLVGFDGASTTKITASSGTTLTGAPSFSGIDISNIQIENTGNNGLAILQSAGIMTLRNCIVKWDNSTNGHTGQCVYVDGAIFSMIHGTITYDAEGDAVGVNTHNVIELEGAVDVVFNGTTYKIDLSDRDDNLNFLYETATSTSELSIRNVRGDFEMLSASYSGTANFMYTLSDVAEQYVEISHLHMRSAGAGTGTIYNINSPSGGMLVRSQSNAIEVDGFTNNYFANIAANDTLNSYFDDIVAVDEEIGAGVYSQVNSPSGNIFKVTDDIHAQYIEFNDASNSYVGADKIYTDYFAFANDYTNFWLGIAADQNIWMNFEKNADIIVGAGAGGDTDIIIQEGNTNKTTLNQDGIDFKVQVGVANGDIVLEPNGSGGVGIGTAAPNELLEVNGDLLADTVEGSVMEITGQYTLPTSDGANGQVIKTNGSGVLSWEDDGGGGVTNVPYMRVVRKSLSDTIVYDFNTFKDLSNAIIPYPSHVYTYGETTVDSTLFHQNVMTYNNTGAKISKTTEGGLYEGICVYSFILKGGAYDIDSGLAVLTGNASINVYINVDSVLSDEFKCIETTDFDVQNIHCNYANSTANITVDIVDHQGDVTITGYYTNETTNYTIYTADKSSTNSNTFINAQIVNLTGSGMYYRGRNTAVRNNLVIDGSILVENSNSYNAIGSLNAYNITCNAAITFGRISLATNLSSCNFNGTLQNVDFNTNLATVEINVNSMAYNVDFTSTNTARVNLNAGAYLVDATINGEVILYKYLEPSSENIDLGSGDTFILKNVNGVVSRVNSIIDVTGGVIGFENSTLKNVNTGYLVNITGNCDFHLKGDNEFIAANTIQIGNGDVVTCYNVGDIYVNNDTTMVGTAVWNNQISVQGGGVRVNVNLDTW